MSASSRMNSMPEFVELRAKLHCEEENKENRFIRVDLRIQPSDLENLDGEIVAKISVVRAVLSLELSGLEVKPSSRIGEPVKGESTKIKTAIKEVASSSKKIEGNANIGLSTATKPDASAKSSVGGAFEKTTLLTREVNVEQSHIYVKARGNDTWEVTEVDGGKLDGTYLDNEKLCEFLLRSGANLAGVTSQVEVKQRDLHFDFVKGNVSWIVGGSKKKLAAILVAKSLAKAHEPYNGKLILSRSEDEYE